jgi:hypothetical protein
MDYSLSNKDIMNFFDGKLNMMTYDQIANCRTIDEVLGPYEKCVILYFWQDKPKVGHWVTIFKTPRNTVEFFNSFGSVPDKTLDEIPTEFKNKHGEGFKSLCKLLYESPYEIEYNDKCLQDDTSSVCGRYVILRLCTEMIPIETFQKLFTKNKRKNDELVLSIVS